MVHWCISWFFPICIYHFVKINSRNANYARVTTRIFDCEQLFLWKWHDSSRTQTRHLILFNIYVIYIYIYIYIYICNASSITLWASIQLSHWDLHEWHVRNISPSLELHNWLPLIGLIDITFQTRPKLVVSIYRFWSASWVASFCRQPF